MKDCDNNNFEVGYEMIQNGELGYPEPLFWIDAPGECVTLMMDRKQMDQLASAIQFLKANLS